MSSEIEKRLKRLAETGICLGEDKALHEKELKGLAEKTISAEEAKKKAKYYKALSDITRLRILGLLSIREMCVCEVMVALELTQPTASHHLRILESVGLVKDMKEGKWVFYALNDPIKTSKLLKY